MLSRAAVALGSFVILLVILLVFPFGRINWGRISILPAATITVTGQAQGDVANQMASFTATVSVTNANKDTATSEVNTKMASLVQSLKDFGIAEADLKTQSINVYQNVQPEILIYPPVPRAGNDDWQASNTIEITVRDANKASEVSDILNKSGATNIYGPNLTTDPNNNNDSELLTKAVEDARKKAESIAKAGGQSLGKMVNVQESGSSYPMYYGLKDMAVAQSAPSTPIEPGTSTSYKTVTVIWELK